MKLSISLWIWARCSWFSAWTVSCFCYTYSSNSVHTSPIVPSCSVSRLAGWCSSAGRSFSSKRPTSTFSSPSASTSSALKAPGVAALTTPLTTYLQWWLPSNWSFFHCLYWPTYVQTTCLWKSSNLWTSMEQSTTWLTWSIRGARPSSGVSSSLDVAYCLPWGLYSWLTTRSFKSTSSSSRRWRCSWWWVWQSLCRHLPRTSKRFTTTLPFWSCPIACSASQNSWQSRTLATIWAIWWSCWRSRTSSLAS